MRTFHERTADAARGKWRGILMELGIPGGFLDRRPREHGPCPICPDGGKDRFRFDDSEGRGTWICNKCGSGDGVKLAMLYTGQSFLEVASRIDDLVRNVRPDAVSPCREMTEDDRREALRSVWKATVPCVEGDLVHRYLASRGLDVDVPESLRFAERLRDGEGGVRPAMVAMVSRPDGLPATLHRTFLRPDGLAKAEMASPRKLMPGSLPEGSAIRLGPPSSAMGVAEGIETALAASQLFELPVWAAINDGNLGKWVPPDNAEEVFVFADNDPGFAGQSAAFVLAKRLRGKGLEVVVRVPERLGEDWCDALGKRA